MEERRAQPPLRPSAGTTHEGKTPTLADLAPLYHAVAHGCRAGRHQEALDKVYMNRICRRLPNGQLEFYSSRKLGAASSNLAAISWFFDQPYGAPTAALTQAAHSWVLGEASFALSAQGRLQEALPALRVAGRTEEETENWRNAAISASNLSQTELLLGRIAAATATAETSVALADRAGDAFQMLVDRATQADVAPRRRRMGRRPRIYSPTLSGGRRRGGRNIPCSPRFRDIGTATCCCRGGKLDEARGRAARTIDVAARRTTGFSTSRSTP